LVRSNAGPGPGRESCERLATLGGSEPSGCCDSCERLERLVDRPPNAVQYPFNLPRCKSRAKSVRMQLCVRAWIGPVLSWCQPHDASAVSLNRRFMDETAVLVHLSQSNRYRHRVEDWIWIQMVSSESTFFHISKESVLVESTCMWMRVHRSISMCGVRCTSTSIRRASPGRN